MPGGCGSIAGLKWTSPGVFPVIQGSGNFQRALGPLPQTDLDSSSIQRPFSGGVDAVVCVHASPARNRPRSATTGSLKGGPRNSIPTGTPIGAFSVGVENPAGTVMAGNPASAAR